MLDLFTLLGAVGLESEVLNARQTVTGHARGNIFNQSESGSEPEEESTIHKLILSLLSALPDTPSLEGPKPAKSA